MSVPLICTLQCNKTFVALQPYKSKARTVHKAHVSAITALIAPLGSCWMLAVTSCFRFMPVIESQTKLRFVDELKLCLGPYLCGDNSTLWLSGRVYGWRKHDPKKLSRQRLIEHDLKTPTAASLVRTWYKTVKAPFTLIYYTNLLHCVVERLIQNSGSPRAVSASRPHPSCNH